jgi:hypothetical protein
MSTAFFSQCTIPPKKISELSAYLERQAIFMQAETKNLAVYITKMKRLLALVEAKLSSPESALNDLPLSQSDGTSSDDKSPSSPLINEMSEYFKSRVLEIFKEPKDIFNQIKELREMLEKVENSLTVTLIPDEEIPSEYADQYFLRLFKLIQRTFPKIFPGEFLIGSWNPLFPEKIIDLEHDKNSGLPGCEFLQTFLQDYKNSAEVPVTQLLKRLRARADDLSPVPETPKPKF